MPNFMVRFSKYSSWVIPLLLVLCIVFNVGSVISSQGSKYFTHDYWQRFPALKQVYYASQYATKHPVGWIPDEAAFDYAGGALISGVNPILVVPDAPPLGKYFIGLSAIIFGNEHIIVLLFGVVSLLMLFILGRQIFHSVTLALIPPTLFSFEKIFKNQFIYTPLLDFMQLTFLLIALYFFNMGRLKKKPLFFFLASIAIGCFISIKFFVSGITIIAAMLLVLLLHKAWNKIIWLGLSFLLAPVVLLSTYIRSFMYDPNIHRFLGIQKWIFEYHKGQIMLPFTVWPLLMTNRWYVWFGNKPIISDPQWSITWPIITIISFATIVLYILKKIPRTFAIEVLMAWQCFYLLFLCIGQIFSRYFLILIPIMYIVSLFGIKELIAQRIKK